MPALSYALPACFHRALGNRQQRLIRSLHFDFIGVRIGRGDDLSVAAENKGGAGFPHGQLRQELCEPGVFDDNGEHTLPLLIDVHRAGIGDRRTLAYRKVRDLEPARFLVRDAFAVPFLIGDNVVGVLESALLELNVADHDLIGVDAAFDCAFAGRDLHHFQAEVAELVCGKEIAVRKAESDPGDARLRLQLR